MSCNPFGNKGENGVQDSFIPGMQGDQVEAGLHLKLISGDNQSKDIYAQVDPIKVQVLNQLKRPMRNRTLVLTITQGDGVLTANEVTTDANGIATINWRLGTIANQTNQLHIAGKKAFDGSPAELNIEAMANTPGPNFEVCNLKTTIHDTQSITVEFNIPPYFNEFTLLRDGVPVFTTLNMSDSNFSDTGLSEGTAYTYTCQAENHFNNIVSDPVTKTASTALVSAPNLTIERNQSNLNAEGVTTETPGKIWDINFNPAGSIASLKIFRKLTTTATSYPVGNEEECNQANESNCLIFNNLATSYSRRDKHINNQNKLYHNYRIEIVETNGNESVLLQSVNTQYPVQVATGDQHTCALFNHGEVSCWGRGAEGQLGYPGRANVTAEDAGYVNIIDPVLDPGATKVVSLKAKSNRTCVVLDNDRVKCWGQGRYINPARGGHWGVYTWTGASCSTTGAYYVARTYDSTLDANSYWNILADINLTPTSIPSYEIHPGEEIDDFDLSDNIQCANVPSSSGSANAGHLKCWGKPVYSSRFSAFHSNSDTRQGHHQTSCLLGNSQEVTTRAPQITDARYAFAWSCGPRRTTIRENWNRCSNGFQFPENNDWVNMSGFADPTETISKYSVGNRHVCAVFKNALDEDIVRCWGGGHNDSNTAAGMETALNNLLGVGGRYYGLGRPYDGLYVPILAEDPLNSGDFLKESVVDIKNSGGGTCVILAPTENSGETKNKIRCWGDNSFGQYGQAHTTSINIAKTDYSATDNTAPTVAPPVQLNSSVNPVKLYAFNDGHSYCALTDEGNVYCWGYNSVDGFLGTGNTAHVGDDEGITTSVATSSRVINLDMGTNHVCSLLLSGEVQCWGNNGHAKLGVSGGPFLAPSDSSIVNLN